MLAIDLCGHGVAATGGTNTKNAMTKKTIKAKSLRPSAVISGQQRLNRVLAAAGLGSRRDVEQLIIDGRIEVDGKTVTDLAMKVDPKVSEIEFDGTTLRNHRPVYYALNKPSGVLSTNHDPSGRTRVIDLVPSRERIFPVGRLDRSSEGLMLLTNDGDLAQRLAHPKFGVQKTYFVVVQGIINNEDLAKLKKGIYLADGVARIDGAKIRRQRKTCTEIEIILSEGKNREIRRILARVGHKVVVLRRIAIGPLRLAQLPVGQTRVLTSSEVEALYSATTVARQQVRKSIKPKGAKRGSPARGGRPQAAPRLQLTKTKPKMGGNKMGSVLAYDETPAEPKVKSDRIRTARDARAAGSVKRGGPKKARPAAKRMRTGKTKPQSRRGDGKKSTGGR
jgi:23S rRNA pseudouridine2605 synthase